MAFAVALATESLVRGSALRRLDPLHTLFVRIDSGEKGRRCARGGLDVSVRWSPPSGSSGLVEVASPWGASNSALPRDCQSGCVDISFPNKQPRDQILPQMIVCIDAARFVPRKTGTEAARPLSAFASRIVADTCLDMVERIAPTGPAPAVARNSDGGGRRRMDERRMGARTAHSAPVRGRFGAAASSPSAP